MKRDSKALNRRMSGLWLSAFSNLAPELDEAAKKPGENVPCPVKGGVDGFRLFQDTNYTGGGFKQAEGAIPDGIGMLMWLHNWPFPKAFDEVLEWLDGAPMQREARPYVKAEVKPVDETKLRAWLNKMWAESLPIKDTKSYPARAYFSKRRVLKTALAASDIRFHPKLHYKAKGDVSKGYHPAIVCLVRNSAGDPVGLHRTFITTAGMKLNFGKEVGGARKMTPSVSKHTKGRVIRAFSQTNDGVLGVSEGLETAYAVHEVKGIPVWACISSSMLRTFTPPKGVHTIINFVDKDRSKDGESSAEALCEHLRAKGIRLINLLPPIPILDSDEKGVDWADQLIRDRAGFDLIDDVLADLAIHAA